MADVLRHIIKMGYNPRTIIDVGVAEGTYDLYESFPHATHILIEALEEFREYLAAISEKYRTIIVMAAASDAQGEITINVHRTLTGSSLLKEAEGTHVDGVPRIVKAVTIDDICREYKTKGPYLIKVDVQGAENVVINGATDILNDTEVVILEVQLFRFFINGYDFYDIITYMKQKGFCVYDIFEFGYRPLDEALASVDILFVKEDGHFRKTHHWANFIQRQQIEGIVPAT